MSTRHRGFERSAGALVGCFVAFVAVAALSSVVRAAGSPAPPPPSSAQPPRPAGGAVNVNGGVVGVQIDQSAQIAELQRDVAALKARVAALETQSTTHVHNYSTPSVTMVSVPTFRMMLDRNSANDWVPVASMFSQSQPQNIVVPTSPPHPSPPGGGVLK